MVDHDKIMINHCVLPCHAEALHCACFYTVSGKVFLFNLDTTKYEVCHDMVSSVHCYTKITHDMVFFIDVTKDRTLILYKEWPFLNPQK